MLREITISRQEDGGYSRRWYQDERMDLFVWFGPDGEIARFQLAYDKPHAEKAIDWKRGGGYTHSRIDEGTGLGHHPGSPLMIEGGVFAKRRVVAEFQQHAVQIEPRIAAFVLRGLRRYRARSALRGFEKVLLAAGAAVAGWLIARRWRR